MLANGAGNLGLCGANCGELLHFVGGFVPPTSPFHDDNTFAVLPTRLLDEGQQTSPPSVQTVRVSMR